MSLITKLKYMVTLPKIRSLPSCEVPRLDNCSQESLLNYFRQSWDLEETLMKTVIGEETFYLSPDPLRNRLIFYLGHTAAFYINKLTDANLLKQGINPEYETLFAVGVDPETPAELDESLKRVEWPELEQVWQYRDQVKTEIISFIENTPLNLPINPENPYWALLMGIEHNRVHWETSSMLLRQLPVEKLKCPSGWEYAPSHGEIPHQVMREIPGGTVKLGKSAEDLTYAWDVEYGHLEVEVKPFLASQYLITNQQFLKFVEADGYNNSAYWEEEAWTWKQLDNVQHPKFWLPQADGYRYRALFDEIELPLDWPVEVNYYEAIAYCRWCVDNSLADGSGMESSFSYLSRESFIN